MNSLNSLRGDKKWKTRQWLIFTNPVFCKMLIIIVLSHGSEYFHEEGWKNELIFHLKLNYFIKSGIIFGPFMNDLWLLALLMMNR